jgi:hypothetical protein
MAYYSINLLKIGKRVRKMMSKREVESLRQELSISKKAAGPFLDISVHETWS